MSGLGLIPAQQTMSNVKTDRYLLVGQAIDAPDLVSPIALISADDSTNGAIYVEGLVSPSFQGAVSINVGANTAAAAAEQLALTMRGTTTNAVSVYVGSDLSVDGNRLSVNGTLGLGRVYDEVYNQPVSLTPITMVQTDPLLTPTNPEEILRATQTAIAPATANSNFFSVPKTGAYMIQTEVAVGNSGATNTVVIPSSIIGGIPIWKSISLGFQAQGAAAIPYASFEVLGGDFYGDQAFANTSFITKTYTSVAFLTTGTTYVITLVAEAGWNIGSAGQIKTELIAMC